MSAKPLKKLVMAGKEHLLDDLFSLSQTREEDIDTSEIPETLDFRNAERGRFFDLYHRGYDVRSLANWCLIRAKKEDVTPTNMWLNKLTYFMHETALREFRTLLTTAKVEAWSHGPVFREIYGQFDERDPYRLLTHFNRRARSQEIAPTDFGDLDAAILEQVWERYGKLSSAQLRRLSHAKGSPWDIVWSIGGSVNPGMAIDVAIILGRRAGQFHGKQ